MRLWILCICAHHGQCNGQRTRNIAACRHAACRHGWRDPRTREARGHRTGGAVTEDIAWSDGPSPTSPYRSLYAVGEPPRSSIDDHAGTLLLEFGAPWCGHCIAAQPALQALLYGRSDVSHLKIEDGRGKPLGRSFRVKLWPTLVLLESGVEKARAVRPRSLAELGGFRTALDTPECKLERVHAIRTVAFRPRIPGGD